MEPAAVSGLTAGSSLSTESADSLGRFFLFAGEGSVALLSFVDFALMSVFSFFAVNECHCLRILQPYFGLKRLGLEKGYL